MDQKLAMASTRLQGSLWERMSKIMEDEKIFSTRAEKLLLFLEHLKSDQFSKLASFRKKDLLENFFDVLRYRDERRIAQICRIVFEDQMPQRHSDGFPEEMMKALVKTAQGEPGDKIREMVWGFLLKKRPELAETLDSEDFVFGLWSANPVLRNTFIRYLLNNFGVNDVMEAILRQTARKGKPLPVMAFNRFFELAEKEGNPQHKQALLSQILKGSDLSVEESERIWSKYLLSLNRFDLVKIFRGEQGCRMGNPRKENAQQSFNFKARPSMRPSERDFHLRSAAIKEALDGKNGSPCRSDGLSSNLMHGT